MADHDLDGLSSRRQLLTQVFAASIVGSFAASGTENVTPKTNLTVLTPTPKTDREVILNGLENNSPGIKKRFPGSYSYS